MGGLDKHNEYLKKIKTLRLIDDDFMTVCFDGFKEGAQRLLHVMLERDDLTVTEVHTQQVMKNLNGRDIWLDILAEDNGGCVYNFEIQRSDSGADRKRARYHSSMLDAHMLKSGCEFTDLRENYVIFITERDVLGGKKPLYRIERVIVDMDNERFGDGEHILYVNGEVKDSETELGKLMHDFFCSDPDDMFNKVFSDRVKYYKENEEGVKVMCEVFDEVRREGREEGRVEGIEKAQENGAIGLLSLGKLSHEEIASALGMSLDKVHELANKRTA